ncbi:cupin domain-containing protein [Xanthobacter sp. V4C-4]|uniref:cupin domain-containing protein n=1 Tax=Xanthobacter cornucopiae TaxID=3119924 RepID=UPI0037268299
MAPTRWPRAPLTGTDTPKTRWFTPPPATGWTEPVLMEWELRGEAWTDSHVHDEYAYVLEGRLLVSCDGETVEATVGDLVRVPAGSVGRYFAPTYARMLGIYAPNPTGAPITHTAYEALGG